MSAQIIFDTAPLGALIRYSDGTPEPPARFVRKHAHWKQHNGIGRLISKMAGTKRPSYSSPASFTLHHGDFGSAGVIMVVVHFTYLVTSTRSFEILDRPKPGMARVLQPLGDSHELLHLADSRVAAEAWLAVHRYSQAIIEDVGDDAYAHDEDISVGRSQAS